MILPLICSSGRIPKALQVGWFYTGSKKATQKQSLILFYKLQQAKDKLKRSQLLAQPAVVMADQNLFKAAATLLNEPDLQKPDDLTIVNAMAQKHRENAEFGLSDALQEHTARLTFDS